MAVAPIHADHPVRHLVRLVSRAVLLVVLLTWPLRAQGTTRPTSVAVPDLLTWLEDPTDGRTQIWVSGWTNSTLRHLKESRRYERHYLTALASFQAADQSSPIGGSAITIHQGHVYANYRDASEPRGVLRRTTVTSFQEHERIWESLLSVDSLALAEGVPWSLQGAPNCLGDRCLITLATDDQVSVREYDLGAKAIMPNGFLMKAPAIRAVWLAPDKLLVITGDQPRRLALWSRGTAWAEAMEIARSEAQDLDFRILGFSDSAGQPLVILERIDAKSNRTFALVDTAGTLSAIHLPNDAKILAAHQGHLLVALGGSGWGGDAVVWRQGSVVAVSIEAVLGPDAAPALVFELANKESPAESMTGGRDGLLFVTYRDLEPQLWRIKHQQGRWQRDQLPLREPGAIDVVAADHETGIGYVMHQSPISPPKLFAVDIAADRLTALRQAAASYDVGGMVMERFETPSADGIVIPYTVIRPKPDRKNRQKPALIAVHGAGDHAIRPRHDALLGRLWLAQGGIYVIAHVRGGPDLGPAWRNAGTNRERVDEDLTAVAKDLIRRRITTSRYLGLVGRAEGAATVGVALNRHSNLFAAAVLESPVLDFNRWRRLDRFGDWDRPEQRSQLQSTSPYQNLVSRKDFPSVFLTAASRDTIYPWMARKYGERLTDLGKPFYYIERPGSSVEGLTLAEAAEYSALVYTYLAERLMPLSAKMR